MDIGGSSLLEMLSHQQIMSLMLCGVGCFGGFLYTFGAGILAIFNKNPPPQRHEAAATTPTHHEVTQPSTNQNQDHCFLDEMTLRCEICFEMIHNVMSVAACNHKFCAACILKWNNRNVSCPKCRIPVEVITYDSLVQQIIDQYAEKYPDRVRSQEERKKANETELKYLEKMMNPTGTRYQDEFGTCRQMRIHMKSEYANHIRRLRSELATAPTPATIFRVHELAAEVVRPVEHVYPVRVVPTVGGEIAPFEAPPLPRPTPGAIRRHPVRPAPVRRPPRVVIAPRPVQQAPVAAGISAARVAAAARLSAGQPAHPRRRENRL